jgi:flavin reductase
VSDAARHSVVDPAPDRRAAFLSAMRKVAATVSLVTTREDGTAHGMAATAISSLCADPPALLVCVKRSASVHGPISRVKWFCVNLLGEQHDALFSDFTARQGSARFDVGHWIDGPNGLPCLADATATLICSLEQQVDYGTHTICIGRVESVAIAQSGMPLLYQDGGSGMFSPLRPSGAKLRWTVGNVIYPVADIARAVAFYRDVVGLPLKFQDGDRWAAFDCHGTTLALERRAPDDGVAQRVRVSLKASGDWEALIDSFRSAGATVGVLSTGAHERTATLTDVDGNQTILYAPLNRATP